MSALSAGRIVYFALWRDSKVRWGEGNEGSVVRVMVMGGIITDNLLFWV